MKKILILFDGPHLAFSPTPIQLYDQLCSNYDVTIIAQNPENFTGQEVAGRKVLYHRYYAVKGRILYRLFFKLLLLFNKDAKLFRKKGLSYRDYLFKFRFLKRNLSRYNYSRIICIDIANLFYCSLLKKKIDFLSLELTQKQDLLTTVDERMINCVIIQSMERFHYLFKEKIYKIFLIQNAPVYREMEIDLVSRKNLIFAGSAIDAFGFYHCLRYLKQYPDEVMVVQGAIFRADRERVKEDYTELLEDKRLAFNDLYLDNDDVVNFITEFQIGFCFYNFEDPMILKNYYNYISAPSGKMFKYLAAGVPVVCSNILGFQFVDDFECGIRITELSEKAIRDAVVKIRSSYPFYVENAKTAAKYYSFDKAVAPYLVYLKNQLL